MKQITLLQRENGINEIEEGIVNVKQISVYPEMIEKVMCLTNEQIDRIFKGEKIGKIN